MAPWVEPFVEVVYALPSRQRVIVLPLAGGLTARQAVEQSGLRDEFPELAACRLDIGIFGRLVDDGQVLKDGDRVEIYRPLQVDPREARRRQVADRRSADRRRRGSG
jgi:putative ubiquitin-RnfH superfamily antitoxin RatB of RatAB toxin-antitoxin module